MKYYLLLVGLCCSILSGFSQDKSSVDFVIKNVGINVDGHFKTFTIDADFDANGNLNNLSSQITVTSIVTGIDSRDEHLLKDDYFDVENHKFITLKSSSIIKQPDDSYKVKANLTIKGITKEITIIVNVIKTAQSNKVTSNFKINRKNFKVGGNSFILGNVVRIKVIYDEKI